MATRIVSWGTEAKFASPKLSKTPSMISFNSLNSDNLETRAPVEGASHATKSQVKYTSSQAIEPSGSGASSSVSVCPGDDVAEDSFIRHHKYFFKDGNVTFLVGNTLYCVHRYFFSRDSIYFSNRFTQLDIRDHEAFPTIISLEDIEDKDFDSFLSILYPENFDNNCFSYEEWKSVLHLSTRWDFTSIRKLALNSIEPPTPHDRLLLSRRYLVDNWVIPALSALCERVTPLSLSEARQMSIEDVVLVSTVREDIRSHALQVDSAEIPLRVEAEQLGALGLEIPDHLRFPKHEASSTVDMKRMSAHEGDDKLSAEEGGSGNMSTLKGESAQCTKSGPGEGVASRAIETDTGVLFLNDIGIQRGGPKEYDNDVAICVPPVTGPAISPILPSFPVGRGISLPLPFGQLLRTCDKCNCKALIAWSIRMRRGGCGVVCLDHGLEVNSATRDLVLLTQSEGRQYTFISLEHKAVIQAFLKCGS